MVNFENGLIPKKSRYKGKEGINGVGSIKSFA
jgi:hypothetical protein